MNSSSSWIDERTVRFEIIVPAEQVDEALARRFPQGITQYADDAARQQVGAELADAVARDAFLHSDIRLSASPTIRAERPLTPGAPYHVQLDLEVVPRPRLSDSTGLTVRVPEQSVVDDAAVDARLQLLRVQMATLVPIIDRGVEPNDVVLFSLTPYVDERPTTDGGAAERFCEIGKGAMPRQLEQGMIGMMPGEKKSIRLELAHDGLIETVAYDVTIKEISQKRLPDVDDNLAKAVGLNDLTELRSALHRSLSMEAERERTLAIERGARAELAKRLQDEVPEELVEAHFKTIWAKLLQEIGEARSSLSHYCEVLGFEEEDVRRETRERAEQEVREGLALEALFSSLGFVLEKEDVEETLADIAAAQYTSPIKIRDEWEHQKLPALKEKAIHRRATQWLLENVQVVVAK